MAQLHVYADGFDTVPTEIANNISSQIQPPDRIPKGLDEYSEQEIKDFPKLWDYPKDYRPVWNKNNVCMLHIKILSLILLYSSFERSQKKNWDPGKFKFGKPFKKEFVKTFKIFFCIIIRTVSFSLQTFAFGLKFLTYS